MSGLQPIHEIDVRGLIRLRLVNAVRADVAAVEAQVGLPAQRVAVPAEGRAIIISYMEQLVSRQATWRRIGPSDLLWSPGEEVLLVRGERSPRWMSVALDSIGGDLELRCERGIGRVPQLVPLLNLSLLATGVLPLHASAFVHGGTGTVAAGWSQSGKTEMLLAAAADGAQVISDEWTYVAQDGRAHGLPTPVRIEGWHAHHDGLFDRAEPAVRGSLRRLRTVDGALRMAGQVVPRVPLSRHAGRAIEWLVKRAHVDVRPAKLFGASALLGSMPLERLLWMVPTDGRVSHGAALRVDVASPDETVERMAMAHVHHRLSFLDLYWRHCYAFPRRRSQVVELMAHRERELLDAALRNVALYAVEYPRRLAPASLLAALAELGQRKGVSA